MNRGKTSLRHAVRYPIAVVIVSTRPGAPMLIGINRTSSGITTAPVIGSIGSLRSGGQGGSETSSMVVPGFAGYVRAHRVV
jgi:hypothetical protein